MDCHHFAAGRCRSCTLLDLPRTDRLAALERRVDELVACPSWLPTVTGPEAGFRTRSKMAVAGTSDRPTLGILDRDLAGVDLRDCPLHTPGIEAALGAVADFVTRADLTPYDVAARRGELKHVLLTESPDGELMLRLVLRSTAVEARVRKHLPWLLARLPSVRVVTLNIQPAHTAVIEGEREIVISEQTELPMRLATGVRLHLGPRAFFQTNTGVAEALYAQARDWVDGLGPGIARVWDLYCGVGGFALHLAGPGRDVLGVEVAGDAVAAARRSAAETGAPARFEVGDATAYAVGAGGEPPDLVVVNPPRRGIGDALADWLESSGVPHVLYSSCHPDSLAADLARMPSLAPVQGRMLDMFPHTGHVEVIVLLARVSATMEPTSPRGATDSATAF